MSRPRRATRPPPARLEEIIKRLDSGEAGLRETLDLCQEGRGLVEFCAGELDAVGRGLEELRLDELVARLEQRPRRRAGSHERALGEGRRPAAGDRGLRAWSGCERDVSSALHARLDRLALPRRRPRGPRRGRQLRGRGPGRAAGRRRRRSRWPARGRWSRFCDHLATLDLWPEPARHDASVLYRVWAYESAALDLALRQAGIVAAGGARPRGAPVTFVVSLRLGEPATIAPLRARLDRYPGCASSSTRRPSWDDALVAELVGDRRGRHGRLEGLVQGVRSSTTRPTRRSTAASPRASPTRGSRTRRSPRRPAGARAPPGPHHLGRQHPHVADIVRCRSRRRWSTSSLRASAACGRCFTAYEYCEDHGIAMYGGGQFELGVGRGQIQYLAALFHPDGPNDVAPGGYNDVDPPADLATSPLPVAASATGFRWG